MNRPEPPAGHPDPVFAAAELVVRLRELVVLGDPATAATADDRLVWPAEVARQLHRAVGGSLLEGGAFGGPWPLVDSPYGVLAPGLPVVVGRSEIPGPDGVYRRDDGDILREAVGEEVVVARLDRAAPEPGEPFTLLWFGATERYTVARGCLRVEDLFAALQLPLTAALLDRLLVRSGRLSQPLPDITVPPDGVFAPRIEVRRRRELLPDHDVVDPLRLLQQRPEVEQVRVAGDELIVRRLDGEPLRFRVVFAQPSSWELELVAGRHPFVRLRLERVGDSVRYVGTLHGEIDPLGPGVRSRLAFDLQADLVSL